MAKPDDAALLEIDGHTVRISNPAKLYFKQELQLTKLELVHYYLAIAPGALRGIQDRPFVLKRFVNGADGEPFYQKRAPDNLPDYLRTVTLSFPSGRTADEVVIDNAAALAWVVNLGCIELHPHPVRAADLDHPDELRIDLDPGPGVEWEIVRAVALEVQAVLAEAGLRGWPKTSGSRGMHVNVRIEPRWSFTEVRRAALALAREVERRAPALASSKWWKEERHGVFLDYNQNAKDRTTCSAYSVRPLPDARVSTPLEWAEVPVCDPRDFNTRTVPVRFAHSATCMRAWTRPRARWTGCWIWRRATRRTASATHRGRHILQKPPASLRVCSRPRRAQLQRRPQSNASRRPPRRLRLPASRRPRLRPKLPVPDVANPPCRSSSWRSRLTAPLPMQAWSVGRPHTRRPQPCSRPTMCCSTACAALRTSGIATASTCGTCQRQSAPCKRHPTRTTTPPAPGESNPQVCRSAEREIPSARSASLLRLPLQPSTPRNTHHAQHAGAKQGQA